MSSILRTFAVTLRVFRQMAADPRTLGLMFFVPSLLTGLFAWMLNSQVMFDRIGPSLIGLFPFIVMFLLASITTLKERRTGTLERFFTMPMGKGEFIAGYAIAFGAMATIQAGITLAYAVWVCGLSTDSNSGFLLLAAVANAVCGMALGLLASAFASTEFQVIQFMPAFIFPQMILGGLFIPVAQMPDVLQTISDWLPLTHALRALTAIAGGSPSNDVTTEILIVVAVSILSLALGALTLRKRTA